MKRLILILTLAAAAGCGNLSNEDLLFLRALPDKDVALRTPGETSADDPEGVRADYFLGERAKFVTDAGRTAKDINRGVLWVVRLVDAVPRKIPPTTREENKRIWGPFPSEDDKTIDVQVVIERHAEDTEMVYDWAFQFRTRGEAPGEWRSIFSGDFRGERARRGIGTVVIDFAAARALGMEKPGERVPFDRALVTYDLRKSDAGKEMDLTVQFQGADGQVAVDDFGYTYHRAVDGSGRFTIAFLADIGGTPTALRERIELLVRWAPTPAGRPGAGRGDATVSGGDLPGIYSETECWGPEHRRVYYTDSDPLNAKPTEGLLAACVFDAP